MVVQLEQFRPGVWRPLCSQFTLITGQASRMPGPSRRPDNHNTVPRHSQTPSGTCLLLDDGYGHVKLMMRDDLMPSFRFHWLGWLYFSLHKKSTCSGRDRWHITVICRQTVTVILACLVFPGFTLLHLIATGVSCFLGAGLLSFLVYVYCQRFHKPSQESAVIHPTTPNHLNYKGNTTPKNEKYTPMEFKVNSATWFVTFTVVS